MVNRSHSCPDALPHPGKPAGAKGCSQPPAPGVRRLLCPLPALSRGKRDRRFTGVIPENYFCPVLPLGFWGPTASLPPAAPSAPTQTPTEPAATGPAAPSRRRRPQRHGPGRHLPPHPPAFFRGGGRTPNPSPRSRGGHSERASPTTGESRPRPVTSPRQGATPSGGADSARAGTDSREGGAG
ncbi:PREDICTED: predicted GPI-anchored protein 58 [Haliaeetus leucocephalus]|uniref:predicted GPI-anchored protein 58 n=1 Tax=Haliaeetus leucocephalus TaxID=52644 RepID=UPI00053CB6C4|nr:PREDICTED: predicted GPI-anchored protein 58 [Haliaeetus leucocephalus]